MFLLLSVYIRITEPSGVSENCSAAAGLVYEGEKMCRLQLLSSYIQQQQLYIIVVDSDLLYRYKSTLLFVSFAVRALLSELALHCRRSLSYARLLCVQQQ